MVALGVLLVIVLAGPGRMLATRSAGRLLQAGAAERGMAASWRSLKLDFPAGFHATAFTVVSRDRGDTLLAADTLTLQVAPSSLFLLRPEVSGVGMAHARATLPRGSVAAEPDTLEPEDLEPGSGPAAPRVLRSAQALVRAMLLPARHMPRLSWRDVTLRARAGSEDEPPSTLSFDRLELTPRRGGISLAASGTLETDRRVPFEVAAEYGADDRVTASAALSIEDSEGGEPAVLRLSARGRLRQDRGAGEVRIAEPMTITIGSLPMRVTGRAALAGPAFSFRLEADSLTGEAVQQSLPRAVLGPLRDIGTRGRWDYRLALDLDLANPDSVRLHADVIPHGLTLDPARTRLRLLGLEAPFPATVHLPKDRAVTRWVSEENPNFLPLHQLDSLLVHAVLTNEDGGFYRHRGFSEEAVRGAIAHNLRAGEFRRGAGTITMQLARNLYLGHERTLSRKGQEVILAWVLENLAGVSKRRLLEIYLNVIEWGPGVHGAGEAARFYFGRDARRLTIDESLFLTIVIPSPSKWRWRLDRDGNLRPFARAQMHFIGRAMVAKGWLRPEELPSAGQLEVNLAGPARDVIFPPQAAPPDTVSAGLALPRWIRGLLPVRSRPNPPATRR